MIKFKIERDTSSTSVSIKVKVSRTTSPAETDEFHDLNEIREHDQLLLEMTDWLRANSSGFRAAFDIFVLRDENAYTMFVLRWS